MSNMIVGSQSRLLCQALTMSILSYTSYKQIPTRRASMQKIKVISFAGGLYGNRCNICIRWQLTKDPSQCHWTGAVCTQQRLQSGCLMKHVASIAALIARAIHSLAHVWQAFMQCTTLIARSSWVDTRPWIYTDPPYCTISALDRLAKADGKS